MPCVYILNYTHRSRIKILRADKFTLNDRQISITVGWKNVPLNKLPHKKSILYNNMDFNSAFTSWNTGNIRRNSMLKLKNINNNI